MRPTVYSRGTPSERALAASFLEKHGIGPSRILYEKEGEYSAFRGLQNLIKYSDCDLVLIPDYNALGEDEYIRLENYLFLKRNGVTAVVLKNAPDARRVIALSIKRFFGFPYDTDVWSGSMMPYIGLARSLNRRPPFGYRVSDGRAEADETEADLVRRVFTDFANGDKVSSICEMLDSSSPCGRTRFSDSTVRTILRNERYLGIPSKKGYRLEPLITYRLWLEVMERFERETPHKSEPAFAPYVSVKSDRPVVFARNGGPSKTSGRYAVDSDALNDALCSAVFMLASEENAGVFFEEFVLKEREKAKSAFPAAKEQLDSVTKEADYLLEKLRSGDVSRETQTRLERLIDRKNAYEMRQRRIETETELYSVTADEIGYFFSRARRLPSLSFEENCFIANTFVKRIGIRNGRVVFSLISPAEPKPVKKSIDGDRIIEE